MPHLMLQQRIPAFDRAAASALLWYTWCPELSYRSLQHVQGRTTGAQVGSILPSHACFFPPSERCSFVSRVHDWEPDTCSSRTHAKSTCSRTCTSKHGMPSLFHWVAFLIPHLSAGCLEVAAARATCLRSYVGNLGPDQVNTEPFNLFGTCCIRRGGDSVLTLLLRVMMREGTFNSSHVCACHVQCTTSPPKQNPPLLSRGGSCGCNSTPTFHNPPPFLIHNHSS